MVIDFIVNQDYAPFRLFIYYTFDIINVHNCYRKLKI